MHNEMARLKKLNQYLYVVQDHKSKLVTKMNETNRNYLKMPSQQKRKMSDLRNSFGNLNSRNGNSSPLGKRGASKNNSRSVSLIKNKDCSPSIFLKKTEKDVKISNSSAFQQKNKPKKKQPNFMKLVANLKKMKRTKLKTSIHLSRFGRTLPKVKSSKKLISALKSSMLSRSNLAASMPPKN